MVTTEVTIPPGSPGYGNTNADWTNTCLWCLFTKDQHASNIWFEVEP